MKARSPGLAGSLALFLVAAAYFAVGCTLSLEYLDEGQIVYPSWLVSLGAVPYQGFRHLYGPSLFFLNGALLRCFGANLIVIRISLVILKAAGVVLTYVIAEKLVARRFAFLASLALVAVWGTPWWVFNTPYANHYSLVLTLAGLAVFLSLPRHFRAGCLLAGLCFGAAATFKQTAGAFAFSGLALFLILADDPRQLREAPAGPSLPGWLVRAARLVALAGMLAVFVAYLWPRNSAWNVLVLFGPVALTIGCAIFRELRGPVRPGSLAGLWGMIYAGIGTALPLLGFGAYYAAKGLLPEMLFDLVLGLPQKVEWFTPFPAPSTRVLVFLALLAALLGTAWRGSRRRLAAAASRGWWAAFAAVAAALVLLATGGDPLEYARSGAWQGDALLLWFAAPLGAVCACGALLLRRYRSGEAAPWEGRWRALLLVYCSAATSLLLFYPAGDFFHMVMALPVFLPPLAFLAERFSQPAGSEAAAARALPSVPSLLVAALTVWMVAPCVAHLTTRWEEAGGEASALSRATGVRGAEPKFGRVADLVARLDSEVAPGGRLLVLNGEQMLYFLAGRRSALDADEFVFYLAGAGLISDANARSLVDEREAVERLARERPVVVEGGDSPTAGRVRTVFPEMSHYLDAHYRKAADAGGYRVLKWVEP